MGRKDTCTSRHPVLRVACTCCGKMRALTDEETRIVFEKLSKFVGENLRYLVERPDGSYCFRLHRGRVYYVKEALMKWATNVGRKNLISMGVCVGKFTKTKKFHMQITALDVIQSYAKFKMWIKPNAEQAFLYGNHVSKSGLGRVTENMVQYQGVLLYSMSDIPLGFGVTSKTTQECRRAEPATVIAFHQADTGEYIRSETTLV